jgi:hypothetical protein
MSRFDIARRVLFEKSLTISFSIRTVKIEAVSRGRRIPATTRREVQDGGTPQPA